MSVSTSARPQPTAAPAALSAIPGPAVANLGERRRPATWHGFLVQTVGDGSQSEAALRLGYKESTLRGQLNDETGRSPRINDVLARAASWPAADRDRLLDLFGPAELRAVSDLDHNGDGRVDLEDAFDAALDAGCIGQESRGEIRKLCRGAGGDTPDRRRALVERLRAKRRLIDVAIAVLLSETGGAR